LETPSDAFQNLTLSQRSIAFQISDRPRFRQCARVLGGLNSEMSSSERGVVKNGDKAGVGLETSQYERFLQLATPRIEARPKLCDELFLATLGSVGYLDGHVRCDTHLVAD